MGKGRNKYEIIEEENFKIAYKAFDRH